MNRLIKEEFNTPIPIINPIRSSCHVISVTCKAEQRKIFQIMFSRSDGSIFINFPYYRHSQGIASLMAMKAGPRVHEKIKLADGGKVTSHRVKYTHHPDGRVHFSQDRKIYTAIKKQSVPLASAHGHIFTVQFQGIDDFELVNPQKDRKPPSGKRTLLNMDFPDDYPEAIKIVGRWYSAKELIESIEGNPGDSVGPIIPCKENGGSQRLAMIVSPPQSQPFSDFALMISCVSIPRFSQDKGTALTFIGGFDQYEIATNLSVDSSFLALSYPTNNYDELLTQIGTIDFP